jgi:hypothetical protein
MEKIRFCIMSLNYTYAKIQFVTSCDFNDKLQKHY